MTIKLLAVSGSMRENSYSSRLAILALTAAREHGAETRLLELKGIDLPTYNPDKEAMDHPGLRAATETVNWADAFLLASPDYHGSMSGALKNFLDFYWTEFAGKLFGYLCASLSDTFNTSLSSHLRKHSQTLLVFLAFGVVAESRCREVFGEALKLFVPTPSIHHTAAADED